MYIGTIWALVWGAAEPNLCLLHRALAGRLVAAQRRGACQREGRRQGADGVRALHEGHGRVGQQGPPLLALPGRPKHLLDVLPARAAPGYVRLCWVKSWYAHVSVSVKRDSQESLDRPTSVLCHKIYFTDWLSVQACRQPGAQLFANFTQLAADHAKRCTILDVDLDTICSRPAAQAPDALMSKNLDDQPKGTPFLRSAVLQAALKGQHTCARRAAARRPA